MCVQPEQLIEEWLAGLQVPDLFASTADVTAAARQVSNQLLAVAAAWHTHSKKPLGAGPVEHFQQIRLLADVTMDQRVGKTQLIIEHQIHQQGVSCCQQVAT